MTRLRFVMVGGFLGAGKTTTLARLTRFYTERGLKVGLRQRQQIKPRILPGHGDALQARKVFSSVEEIAGALFLLPLSMTSSPKSVNWKRSERPDVIPRRAGRQFLVPTLVATVVQPLKDLYGDRFEVAPYPVLFKPSHGLRILKGDSESQSGFSPKAAYIFRKQLEEADAIVLNRVDELSPMGARLELRRPREAGVSGNAGLVGASRRKRDRASTVR